MERKNNHHYCNFCTKSFMTVGSRNDHERNVHEKLRPHKCDQCGQRFYRKFNLKSHKRKHSTDYSHSCKICDKRFRSDLSVKVHMKTHTNHRPFMCEVCGKVFKTLSVLEAHNNIHTKQTKYDCRLCEKSYSYRASLFLHMRTHTGQRPYQCKDCNASFIVKSHLTDHKRTHTRERPFECKYCLSSFARKVSLKKHLHSHIRAGVQVNIEEALLHQQSKSKGPSVTLSNKNLPIVSDTTLASRKTISLDHSVESIIVYTNLPPEEDELVTVVISCKKREVSCCSVKDPSVYLDHHSQKVIVENAYDTGYEIADHESCVSEVVKREENSPFALSSIAGEGFEGLQILNEDSPISVPDVSIVCEVKDTSLHQLPSNCVVLCPNNISVSPSNTDRPSLTSQAVLRKVEDVARISTKYDNKHISEENKLIDSISETDIQGLLSDFDDRQRESVKTIKQVNATKDEPIIDDRKFQADKSIACVIESKTPICETREDKSNFVRKCKYCGASYRYLACLKIHEEMHKQGDLRISTKNVDSYDSFVQFEKITNQTPLVVDSNHPFTCEVCGAGFSFRSELRKHVKLHSLKYCYVCKKCNQAFQQEVFLTRHKCLSSDSSSVFTIQSFPSVHEHLIETKKITQEFKCCKCRTVIERADNLNVNDSLTGILCNKCQDRDISSNHEWSYENRLSHSKNELEVKQKKDESEREYPVELKFVEETLDQEKPNETQDQSENSLHLVDNLHDVIDDMKDVCLDESLSLPLDDCGLEVTIQTDNQDLKKKDSDKLRKFRKGKFSELMRCQYCPMLFKYNSTLRTHERIHTGEKPFSCSVCSKTFSKKSNMKLHQRIHTGERSFLCDYCGKYFSYKSSLDAHKQLHTNELPYICIICGKGFRYESSRSVHLKRHMGNKAFKCDFCPKAFVSKVEMEDHRRMHTGEKPYQCNDCGRSFSYRHHLVDHHRIHTGHKPYRCHVCNVHFSRWGMLKSHLQKHSGAVNP